MATPLSGTAGSVVYMTGGTTLVGEIAEWRLNMDMSPQEVTAFGDTWTEFVPSVKNATFTLSGNFVTDDSAQTSLLNAFIGGSAVAARLYVTTTKYWNVANSYCTGLAPGISQKGKAEVQYTFQNSGTISLV